VARGLGSGTGEEFRVEVESLDQDGRGVAHRDGKAVFVEGALPGERVVYERRRNKPSYETGRVVRIEHASVLRVAPRCPHAGLHPGACGGCSMQHVEPAAQVAIKQRVLEDTLWHIGRVRPERVLRPVAGPQWRYRHRARFSVRDVAKKGGVLVGFHERASSYVADMRQCEVVPLHVSELLLPLRELVESLTLRDRLPQIELAVAELEGRTQTVLVFRVLSDPTTADRARLRAFAARHAVQIWLQTKGPETAQPMDEGQPTHLELALPEFGVRIPFGPTDFTQVNHRINEILVGRAVRLLEPQPHDVVADFFCGLGNFTLPLATLAQTVVGLEGSAALVGRARAAAALNRLDHRAKFNTANLFEWTLGDWQRLVQMHGGIGRVLIDPPREGALELARSLAASTERPQRVVYVSCNPATLARDCAVLVHEGAWKLRAAGVVNMFPHTSHVESIAMLEPAS
jgi:23S rRNA (uracil1939-C5)-methyltransferase